MIEKVLLVEIALTVPATAETSTLFFSDAPMPPFGPVDGDRPNQAYDPRLIDGGNISRGLDLENLSGRLGGGAITLSNNDRSLDQYRSHAFGAVAIYRGTIGQSFSAFKTLLVGRCGEPEWRVASGQPGRLTLPVYDPRTAFETDIQDSFYGGTNAGGGSGYEGTKDDLKDQPKPLAIGDLSVGNVSAIWANVEDLVAQLNDGPFEGVTTIYNGGGDAGMTSAGVLTGAAFDAATPAENEYVEDRTRGLVKLGSRPVGKVTFDLKGGNAGGYLDTAPDLIANLLLDHGAAPSEIGASLAGAVEAAKVGLWLDQPIATVNATSVLATSIGHALLPDRLGRWQLIKLEAPAGVPVAIITDADILRLASLDGLRRTPTHKITIRYGLNHTTMSGGDLQGSVEGTTREGYLANDYRNAIASDAATLIRWPDALDRTFDTGLVNEADAAALASRLLTLFGPRADGAPRQGYSIAVELTDTSLAYEPGDTVHLQSVELEIDVLMMVTGVAPTSPKRNQVTLELYG